MLIFNRDEIVLHTNLDDRSFEVKITYQDEVSLDVQEPEKKHLMDKVLHFIT